ncbi:hypothetical protein Fmac_019262 [Flemingia macrophylla]|uniref:SBP-type domain-containing protein n=1 Tax=Flemingia macrophylla TaxID=520843 RepID=A0ABD1M7G0_9FABA
MEGLQVPQERLKRDVEDEPKGYVEQEKKKKVVVAGCGGKKGSSSGGGDGGNSMRCCQVEKCNADLHEAKPYHRRHKVCEYHAKAQVVHVDGIRQRFCQQCSRFGRLGRFHELAEFDDTKRSCRRRLAGHNERRRKNCDQSQAEGSSRKGTGPPQLKDIACGQADERGRNQTQENAPYKHFQIR